MRARAPGKLVLSGAYAVLEGAPAIVAAVDRYVTADTDLPAERLTGEVAVAMAQGAMASAPAFDASALRSASGGRERKLGLGSSAAIVVACVGAALAARGLGGGALVEECFRVCLAAHREAQGGGSGIDVAVSAFGGVLVCRLGPSEGAVVAAARSAPGSSLSVERHALPPGTHIEVFACPTEASTRDMLAAVRRLASQDPERYGAWLQRASEACVRAVAAASTRELAAALADQFAALQTLGEAAGVGIVTPAMTELAVLARARGAAFGPSGAGGGDVAIYVGDGPAPVEVVERAGGLGLERVGMTIGAPGLTIL